MRGASERKVDSSYVNGRHVNEMAESAGQPNAGTLRAERRGLSALSECTALSASGGWRTAYGWRLIGAVLKR
jgi:hypothetical protein